MANCKRCCDRGTVFSTYGNYKPCPDCNSQRYNDADYIAYHATVSAAIRNVDGISAASVEARLLAQRYGLDGDDSGRIRDELEARNGNNA